MDGAGPGVQTGHCWRSGGHARAEATPCSFVDTIVNEAQFIARFPGQTVGTSVWRHGPAVVANCENTDYARWRDAPFDNLIQLHKKNIAMFPRLLLSLSFLIVLSACSGSSGSASVVEPPTEVPTDRAPEPSPRGSQIAPFVLPFDDASDDITHMGTRLNHVPAGKFGSLIVNDDGHFAFESSAQRERFWGVNITARSAFPTDQDAEAVAGRLAKFGVNLVRFHHMDHNWGGLGLIDYSQGDSQHFNTKALQRLDYFIAQLKNQGIYTNLNLINAREFMASDGIPASIGEHEWDELDWKERQIMGFFIPEIRALEKVYAYELLTRVNPYTKLTYAQDPAIAFVEINNENSLFQQYLDGNMDLWPDSTRALLQEKWNQWLAEEHDDTAAMAKAWGAREESFGREMLTALDSSAFTHDDARSEEHTSELQSRGHLVCRLLLAKKNEFRQGQDGQN